MSTSTSNPNKNNGVQPSLTLCAPPALDWSRAQAPASDSFGDIYFSVEGGLGETRDVYLKGCGLPQRWEEDNFKNKPFVIGELGFGTGLNFLALWQMWKSCRKDGQRLHFVSVEKFPLAAEDLARALEAWPELKSEAAALIKHWPDRVRGTHILHFGGGLTLTLIHDDVEPALAGLSMRADGWFLDGFSPAKNPAMWSASVLRRVGELSAAGARIGTFTAAGFVREGLSAAGFEVSKTKGFGRKRHRLEAVMPEKIGSEKIGPEEIGPEKAELEKPETGTETITPIIIGAGIAGASLAQAFARRGIKAIVIDPDDGTAASANAAAIVMPRLDRQDNPLARFALSAYLYALQTYENVEAVISRGVTHAPPEYGPESAQMARYIALTDEPSLPASHMYWDAENEAAIFPKAQVIDPHLARAAMLQTAQQISGRVAHVKRIESLEAVRNGYAALDAKGNILARGSHVFWTIGADVRGRGEFDPFDLRYSRGQISWARSTPALTCAFTYGGYAIPMSGSNTGEPMLLGATHDPLEGDDPYALRKEDDAHNFNNFEQAVGEAAVPTSRPSRASIRVNSKTTWPFIAELEPNVHVLTGLGSRGFVFAPLMAEMSVADICGEPVVWPAKLKNPKVKKPV